MWQYGCIATWGLSTSRLWRQSFDSALITMSILKFKSINFDQLSGTRFHTNWETTVKRAASSSHWKHCSSVSISVSSALEVYLYTTMRYINRRFTYLLNYMFLFYDFFFCWYMTLCCDLDLWRCILICDPLTLTFVVYRLWRDEMLYQIWAKSNNPRRSYCNFIIWPYDLEHVSRVVQRSGIIFTKFKLSQVNLSVRDTLSDADTLCHAARHMLDHRLKLFMQPLTDWTN